MKTYLSFTVIQVNVRKSEPCDDNQVLWLRTQTRLHNLTA